MIRRLSEDIMFLMIKNKILDIQSYDIYIYAIEIILLNGSIVLTNLLISIFTGTLYHMLAFVLFFIPLRMLTGGYHCKKSRTCFVCSNIMYIASVFTAQYLEKEYANNVMQIFAIISVIVILIFSPLINPNHPLEKYQVKRSRRIVYVIIAVDFAMYAILYNNYITIASSELIFIILVALLLILGRVENIKRNITG